MDAQEVNSRLQNLQIGSSLLTANILLNQHCERFEPRSHFKNRLRFDRLGERSPE